MPNLYVALVHHPVVNKAGDTIAAAVTNLDLHDIARTAKTYGVKGFYVTTPLADQQHLVRRITAHWLEGPGGRRNPKRREALALIRLADGLEPALAEIGRDEGRPPRTVATAARRRPGSIGFGELRRRLAQGSPHVLVLGTAWGLAPAVFEAVDTVLEPVKGPGPYNHLPVRAAAAVILDRLLGCREGLELKTD
ncbi:MAG TPA: RNA methyltransferase [Desulfobacterales bacterium]|jgi:hypothetical protein|nr:RNA methyltransferase [Desulfobacterales bacterium]